MTAAPFFIFFISFMEAFSPAVKANYYLDDYKAREEPNFFETKIFTQYSKLLAIDDGDAFCEDSEDIIFPDTSTKSLYYRCQNGKKELYQCVEGFEFDSVRLRCSHKVHVNETLNDCSHQMDGFYPDYSSDCQEYFRCKNSIKVERLSCAPHQSFSYVHQNCQLKEEVRCIRANCHIGNDGFFVFPGSKCQAYYYCLKGIRSDFICPKSTIFSRQSKSCVESGICYESVCTGRIDGRYPDTTHDCIRSFDCKGGVLEEVNSCPAGQKFNGQSCSPLPFEHCEKPEKTAAAFYFRANDECKNLRDGNHVVPGTDCRSVRICLRGRTATAFECPKNMRFDGGRCLSKNLIPCDDACSMKGDGYYADEFTDCQSYYSCLNGELSRRKQCPDGNAFNGHMCIPSHLVVCPKKHRSPTGRCLGLRDGFHPDYLNGCRNYFYCYNQEMVLTGICSTGMIWNGKECVERSDSICEGPREINECAHLAPGLYQNKTSGCTKYFYCNNGSGTSLSCPDGEIFNGDKCISADEYTCSRSDECANQPDGYRQDMDTGCRSYFYCSNGNKIVYVCPYGSIFNGTQCVASHSYQCPFNSSGDCIGKHDGYHPDISSDCKKYFYCFKGEKLMTLSCGGKRIFDGERCVAAGDPKSVCFGMENNPCRQKKDGTYIDPSSECRKYFTCRNKTLINENYCPKGFGFNGVICQKDYSCFSKSENSVCQNNQIGFYQDLESNCKNYYFCIGRTKTIASCPSGTIFNGQLCIDSNYYTCPSVKT